jgi:hypothetical protein
MDSELRTSENNGLDQGLRELKNSPMLPRERAIALRKNFMSRGRVGLLPAWLVALSGLSLMLSGCTGEIVGGSACAEGVSVCGDSTRGDPPGLRPPALVGEPCNGYTLLSHGTGGATLIDMAGNTVHQWAVGGFPPAMRAGGSLTGCAALLPGATECMQMQEVSWFGEPLWSFADWAGGGIADVAARQHHDFQLQGDPVGYYAPGQVVAERGSVLVLAYARRSRPEIRDVEIDDDVIYELDGFGNLTNVVWYGADHVDEFGFDEQARAHLRTIAPGAVIDWLHGNALSALGPNRWFDEGRLQFHPDNIMYSSRHANFVAILSRETGAVVWRVGPDFAGRPEERLGQFVGQHNPHLIPKGLPGAGNVLVFDNGGNSGYGGANTSLQARYTREYSRIVEFNPVTLELVWEYGGEFAPERFSNQLVGGAQRLPNGNTLVTIGLAGRVIEVTPERRVVWEYQNAPAPEGGVQWLYRAYRVPPEWLPSGMNTAHGNYPSWFDLFEAR